MIAHGKDPSHPPQSRMDGFMLILWESILSMRPNDSDLLACYLLSHLRKQRVSLRQGLIASFTSESRRPRILCTMLPSEKLAPESPGWFILTRSLISSFLWNMKLRWVTTIKFYSWTQHCFHWRSCAKVWSTFSPWWWWWWTEYDLTFCVEIQSSLVKP